MESKPSRRSVIVFFAATTAGTAVASFTLLSSDDETGPEQNDVDDTESSSKRREIEDTLIIEPNKTYTIGTGVEEQYRVVKWHSNGELHLKERAVLELGPKPQS
jgi:hypothetical protein